MNLADLLFRDEAVSALFAEAAQLRSLVAVEVALAVAQGQLGVISPDAAAAIAAKADAGALDLEALRRQTRRDGFPVAELVRQLREQVGGEAASFVHWGATTQDVLDTALVLHLREALGVLEPALQRVVAGLAALAAAHRETLMAARTHSQQALPITFGLKAATWLAPLLRHRTRLSELKPRLFVVQLGGAAGSLAALGADGLRVQGAFASALGLGVPLTPWHAQRDSLAEFAGWLSLVSGSLGKLAQDVILLAQSEVGELRESCDHARGGSSTLPHKQNPIESELIVAAARANAALLTSMHQALIQEHERGTHGWQLEWLSLPQMLTLTASALRRAAWLSENLVVDPERMQANVALSHGLMLAEAASFALSAHIGHAEAKRVVAAAVREAQDGRHLLDVLPDHTSAPLDWVALRDERAYLGVSGALIDAVLKEAR